MYKKWIRQYSGLFILGLLLIATYRLFDNIIAVGNWVVSIADILLPFIVGAVLAYILYIPANALEKKLLKQKENTILSKNARLFSTLITFFAFLAICIIIVMVIFPMVGENVMDFIDRSPLYMRQVQAILRDMEKTLGIPKLYDTINGKAMTYLDSFMNIKNIDIMELVGHGVDLVSSLLSVLMAIVVCPYLIYERASLLSIFDNLMLMMISPRDLRFVHRYATKAHEIFANFIFGKAIDSLIIGVLAYMGFWLLDIKFATLCAIVIGVTNMIPYFGPFIGGVPVALVTVITTGLVPGIWTGVFIFALQQFDGLILGPYILGESVGVSALWIIFAITFFGGTLGFVGMVIGVPLIATIRVFYHDIIRYRELKTIIRKHKILE